MTTIGIIGSGHIGRAVARLAVDAGHDVVLSNSRGPESLDDVLAALAGPVRAATPAVAAEAGDVVVVAVPVKAENDLPTAELAGKIVLVADNYYPARDGQIEALDDRRTTSAGLLQENLPDSRVVKVFNHIRSEDLATQGTPAGSADRRALAIFGDDGDALTTVRELLDGFGYDAVEGGALVESWRVEPGAPAYGPRLNSAELTEALAAATR